ncbi:MAG TPA: hypothetical protein PK406_14630, partial [Verrucomicrobiota bacterium]|nr:hypothetical protein [Verrucomicrobiota bacterium]
MRTQPSDGPPSTSPSYINYVKEIPMYHALQANDYRLPDEKKTLYWGFGIFGVILFFLAADWWLVTAFLVVIAAVMVWIRQSQLLGNAVQVSERQF